MHLNLMAPMFPQLDVNIPEGWWKQDAQLDLDFANRRAYNKFTQFRGRPDSILTYTSPSPKLVYGDDGVLRYAPHNLISISEPTVANLNASANVTNSVVPLAGFDASIYLLDNTVQRSAFKTVNTVTGFTYVGAFYVQRDDGNVPSVGDTASDDFTLFVAGNNPAAIDTTVTLVSGSLYRVTGKFTATATAATVFGIRKLVGHTNRGITVTGFQAYLYPNQSGAYLKTTSAAKYSLPIDHAPVTHAPLGVLIEEQRTNLLTYSEQFDNAAWTKDALTVSANAIAAPDGTTTADKLIPSTSNVTSHRARQAYTFTAIPYSYSAYVKAAGYSWVKLRFASIWANINVSTGEVGFSSGATVTVTDVGNGWYSCVVVGTAGAGDSHTYAYAMNSNENSIDPTAWTGDGTSGLYLWGAQLEAGAFPTSYIPTVASQVTRAADQVSILTSAFPYNAAAGTMAVDAKVTPGFDANSIPWSLDNGSDLERISVNFASATALNNFVVDGGAVQADLDVNAGTLTSDEFFKDAMAWAANDVAAVVNGGTVLTDTSATLPTPDRLRVGSSSSLFYFNGHIKRLTYFSTRKTNAELQGLTI